MPSKPQIESALAPFLQEQRWFGGKARGVKAVRVADWAPFPAGGVQAVLTFVEVELGDGTTDLYFVPLSTGPDGEPIVARRPDGGSRPRRLAGDDRGREGIGHPRRPHPRLPDHRLRRAARPDGRSRCRPSSPLRTPATPLSSTADGCCSRCFAGWNPESTRTWRSADSSPRRVGSTSIPRVAGAAEYLRPGSAPITLAILQELVAHQGDGWSRYA